MSAWGSTPLLRLQDGTPTPGPEWEAAQRLARSASGRLGQLSPIWVFGETPKPTILSSATAEDPPYAAGQISIAERTKAGVYSPAQLPRPRVPGNSITGISPMSPYDHALMVQTPPGGSLQPTPGTSTPSEGAYLFGHKACQDGGT